MSSTYPLQNFDPGSQAWARRVQNDLTNLIQGRESDRSLSRNGAEGNAATMSKLSEQQNLLQATVSKLAGLRTYANAVTTITGTRTPGSTAISWFSGGPTLTFTKPANTDLLVSLSGSTLTAAMFAGSNSGDTAFSTLSFEIVSDPTYTLGATATSVSLAQQSTLISAGTYASAVLYTPVSKTVLVPGLASGTYTLNAKLGGRNSTTGVASSQHIVQYFTLTAQIIPGENF